MLEPRRRPEAGFTVIELVIVVVIAAVLLSIMGAAFDSARTASQRRSAIAAARTMGDAIEDFRKDHAGRPPLLAGATAGEDWSQKPANGPRNRYLDEPYLESAPGALADGLAVMTTGGGGGGGARWRLRYRQDADPAGWSIVVIDGRGTATRCAITGGAARPGQGALAGVGPC